MGKRIKKQLIPFWYGQNRSWFVYTEPTILFIQHQVCFQLLLEKGVNVWSRIKFDPLNEVRGNFQITADSIPGQFFF